MPLNNSYYPIYIRFGFGRAIYSLFIALVSTSLSRSEAELKEGRDRRIVQLRWYILKIFCVQDASQDCTQMELKEENF